MLTGFAYIARPKMCYIMSMRFRFTCVNYNRFGKCTEKAEEFIFVKWFDFILMDFISFYMLQRIFFVILSLDECSIYFYFIDYLLFFLSFCHVRCMDFKSIVKHKNSMFPSSIISFDVHAQYVRLFFFIFIIYNFFFVLFIWSLYCL